MHIGIFGAGYVGLVTAVCLANLGFNVYVVEKDEKKLEKLQSGNIPFYEPDLNDLLTTNLDLERISFTSDASSIVAKTQILFLCVGTPSRSDGSADMSQIESAMKEIVEINIHHPGYCLVVVKSTVPVGTAAWLEKIKSMYSRGEEIDLDIASNPEFLREGAAVKDFYNPDRIIIGSSSTRAIELLKSVYEKFTCPIIETDSNTAEIIKYASNSFLATKISFINMVADLCEEVDADVSTVTEGMGLDPRIGNGFLKAGIGFGGSCFPKDLRAFVHIGKIHNLDFGLLEEVIRINQDRAKRMIQKLREILWVVNGKTIAVLGLAFKPETDDVRETPAAKIIELLKTEGANIIATDPMGIDNFIAMFPKESSGVRFVSDPAEAIRGSHAVIIVTDWKPYNQLDWKLLKDSMELPVILDGRNLLSSAEINKLGFEYASVGK